MSCDAPPYCNGANMSIRFACPACDTTLKIESMIKAPKQVRCTKCNVVIILTPDLLSETGVTPTLFDLTSEKDLQRAEEQARLKKIVLSVLGGIIGLVVLIGLWWTFSPAADRAAISGQVTINDGAKLEKGKITFFGIDNTNIKAEADIIDGRYQLSASDGPALGNNKVQISSRRPSGRTKIGPNGEDIDILEEFVDPDFNTKSTLTADVQSGTNTLSFEVKSKSAASAPPASQ